MRRFMYSLILILSLMLMAAPAIAQDATPESEDFFGVILVESSRTEVFYSRMTFAGAMALGGLAGELDGSVEHPVNLFASEFVAQCKQFQLASTPDIGDERVMLVGTISDDNFDGEFALLAVQSGDNFIYYAAGGLVMVVGDLLTMVDSIAEREPETPEEWLPTLDDLPPGFTLATINEDNGGGPPCGAIQ